MALSNSQYNEIMRGYQQQQLTDKHRLDQRREKAYQSVPQIKELEMFISTKAVDSARRLLDGDTQVLSELREEIARMKKKKNTLLQDHGFSEDYLELQFACPDCQDTGYQESVKCHCFLLAEHKLLYAQSNIDEVIKRENFSTLSFAYYDDKQMIPEIGSNVAAYMRRIVAYCEEFAEKFRTERGNLLFTGETGVGKTFLVNCIARELMEQHYSVIYLSASDLFEVFSKNKFEFQVEEEMKEMGRHILSCDLLIIDDLGTELSNSFTTSKLFYCINERLNTQKSTIISTNLSMNLLRDSYTDRVASRLMSHYTTIPLYGGDIRLQKRKKHTN